MPQHEQYDLTASRTMPLSPATLFRAWTTGLATWLAEPDSIRITVEEGAPFYFELAQHFDDGRPARRHPHYGRFLRLVPDSLVSLTWVTGSGGTAGEETVLTVRFESAVAGTTVTLTHAGFATAAARDAHASAWPAILEQQERKLFSLGDDAASAGTSTQGLPRNRSIPDATLIPVRSYPDLGAAVAWLRDALGCRERLRIHGDRTQLTIGNGAVVVAAWDATTTPATGGRPPATLMVRVADIDTTYQRAIALGATGLAPPADHPHGERQASLRDPFGHAWTLTQTIADVDPATWGGELVR